MEPITTTLGFLLLKYAASHGLFAAAGIGAAGLAVAAVIYVIYLTFSTVFTWFKNTLSSIESRQQSKVSLSAITATVGKPTKTVDVGLMTGSSSTTYEKKYIIKIVKDSITDEVIKTEILEFGSLDEELMDAHRSDAIVLWT
jgi:hypothetical protein